MSIGARQFYSLRFARKNAAHKLQDAVIPISILKKIKSLFGRRLHRRKSR
jgi:hypothetical protein